MSLFVIPHLGLGDLVILRGALKSLVLREGSFSVLCYPRNAESARWLMLDAPSIRFQFTEDENVSAARLKEEGANILYVGRLRGDFDMISGRFDEVFYKQLGVSFENRWCGLHSIGSSPLESAVTRQCSLPVPYAFVHDRKAYPIDETKVGLPIVRSSELTHCIFDWLGVIRGAAEIHCIDSSFLNLVESMSEDGKPLFWHLYAQRQPESRFHPTVRRPWRVLE
jgi:hypothetical protein